MIVLVQGFVLIGAKPTRSEAIHRELYANHSARVAAEAGFVFFDINERYFYLDRDMALDKAGILPGGLTDTTCAQR